MATTKIINDLIDLNQTGNTTALKGCKGDNANQPETPTISVDYLVVGGGGTANGSGSGGGGAGGFSTGTNLAVPNNTAINIVVGLGAAAPSTWDGAIQNGEDSGFYTIQGQGGGSATERADGNPGGSGGGGGHIPNSTTIYDGGAGVTGQGKAGGDAVTPNNWNTGGGGGAGIVGSNGASSLSGDGGYGIDGSSIISITNANTAVIGQTSNLGGGRTGVYFSGGGGGGGNAANSTTAGSGGDGGGASGSNTNSVNGSSGTQNTGGGGGGGNGDGATPGGSGGSGVVILKYLNADVTSFSTTGLAGGLITVTGSVGDCNYPTTALALYQLNSGVGSNVPDTCGNYDGTASNITYTTGSGGKFGEAAIFNGTSSSINTGFAQNTSNAFSWSLWFNADSSQSSLALIIDTTSSSSPYPGVGIGLSSNTNLYAFWSGTTSATFATITSNTWVHVVLTNDGSGNFSFYVNGNSIFTNVSQTTNIYSGQDILLGDTTTWSKFNGNIDQVRIFESTLTANQVQLLYAESSGATKFDDGTNTTLVFKGGSGTINLTGSSIAGPKVGDLRTNTDQTSAGSASAMEHYMSTEWRVFNNCTISACNYPTTASALYQLNDNANDTCGNSNGTFTNPSYVTGKFGNAANFNGSNNYIEVPVADTPSFLVSTTTFWIKTTTSSNDGIIGTGYDSGGCWNAFQAYCYGASGDKLVIRYGPGTCPEGPAVYSISSVNTGDWVFCAVSFSGSAAGSTLKIYINGALETTHTTTVSRADNAQKGLIMGAYSAAGTIQNFFTGAVDQARIFPSVLTASQITELYNESC